VLCRVKEYQAYSLDLLLKNIFYESLLHMLYHLFV